MTENRNIISIYKKVFCQGLINTDIFSRDSFILGIVYLYIVY